MKNLNIVIYILITLLIGYYGVSLTYKEMTGQKFSTLLPVLSQEPEKPSIEQVSVGKCSTKSAIDLTGAQDPHLLALAELQKVCDSFVTDRLMVFTGMPNSRVKAYEMADKMAILLKEFNKYGITPVVIVEPDSDWGLIDFSEFRNGFWDKWIEDYFARLASNKITESQMGIWVPFPEANIPTWNKQSSASTDFALSINKYSSIIRKNYPNVHLSILLNSATYDVDDYDWAYGEYISLNPYLQKIEKGSVQSFGLQGFPWLPRKTSQSTTKLDDPAEYLNYLLPIEAADSLSVSEIWFNTGTFSSKYTNDPVNTILVEQEDRLKILENTILEANKISNRNYQIWINIFAEDKSQMNEATNWSYTDNQTNKELSEKVLKEFLRKAHQSNIKIAFFIKKAV